MSMKVKVKTNFTTFFKCEVEASSNEEAKEKATLVFCNTPDEELHKTFFKNRKFVDEEITITER